MKCLIVAPPFTKIAEVGVEQNTDYEFPLNLAYISAALKAAGHNVSGLNFNRPDRTIEEALVDIEVVLTGGLAVHYPAIAGLIEMVRERSKAIIVIGGGVVSGDPEFAFQSLRPDYAIAGEGEVAVVELLEKIEKGKRPYGVVKAEPIEDIDSLPWADYDIFDVETFLSEQYGCGAYYFWKVPNPRYLPFVGSRGCPMSCTFCFSPLGKRYKPRDPIKFCEEIKDRVERYNLNLLGIVDETLGLDKERLIAICSELKKIGVPWMCQLRVDVATDEVQRVMKDAGCYYISYGIESACNETLKSMRKNITIEQTEKALQLSWDHDIGIQGNILMADPADTDRSIMDSMLWNMRNNRYGINLARLMPFPNSELYQRLLADGTIESKLQFYRQACMWQTPFPRFTKVTENGARAIKETTSIWHYTRPRQPFKSFEVIRRIEHLKTDVCRLNTSCIWCGADIETETYLLHEDRDWDRIVCPTCNKLFLVDWKETMR